MSNIESEPTAPTAGLTSLPRLDDLRQTEGGGYDADAVREAFASFRRHALQLQAQPRIAPVPKHEPEPEQGEDAS